MDTTFLVDIISVLIASACIGFVAYGGWLCLNEKYAAAPRRESQPDTGAATKQSLS